jgi:outer membrane lipoprotein LolB
MLLLSACAPVATRPSAAGDADAQAARERILVTTTDWSFSGRVAVSQAGEGGSARIDWTQRGADFDIRLAAPVTRQSWRLSRRDGRARLEGLDGGPREGRDAEALLLEATGWQLPVDTLAAWVRGVRAGAGARLSSDALGRPALIGEQGWTVEYRSWDSRLPALPLRVFARKDSASVRLVIDQWSAP